MTPEDVAASFRIISTLALMAAAVVGAWLVLRHG